MRFSVIMPVLNGARFIEASIESVRAQQHGDWQLLVMDGGSTDGSLDIAQRHATEDPRIEVHSAPDTGQYQALSRGLDQASGEVLSWLNADDLYTSWALDTAALAFEETGSAWVSGQPAQWDATGRLRSILPLGHVSQARLAAGWHHDELFGCLQQESLFFRRTLWTGLSDTDRTRFASARLAGDFLLWKLFARQAPLTVLSSVLGGFRVHGANRSIRHREEYQAEAYAFGARRLPRLIARRLRGLNDHITAARALRRFREASLALHTGLQEPQ